LGTPTRQSALFSNTDGTSNTAVGFNALFSTQTSSGNTAVGSSALLSNTNGSSNAAFGVNALEGNMGGGGNTAIGASALQINVGGSGNTASGAQALQNNIGGDFNTAVGDAALLSNDTGMGNTAIGASALQNNTSGSNNIVVGAGAGFGVHTANNVIVIGAVGADVSGSCYIANIFGATAPGGAGVFVNSDGKLGTSVSSRRFKEEIKPMDGASEAILALKPVTFRYKKEIDAGGTSQFGLVAEDVEQVNPDLVVRDKEGKPYTVRYDQVNAMLLNEFLKEHARVQQLEANTARQQKAIEALTAAVQRMSAQLALNKPAPRTALTSR
jgi:hypothetical protein